ncbi:Calcium-independent phospholipase A2-gamma-like Protein [Tribolium castaneum]|uniref:Calcium-independent phospholipase A2-gamma-like Protein n=2 Tax=Tribolium castaneum TaxID=7070 RepID=D6WQY5_TRICA|nr:Calcium-independent phospholipase A2-gamma-like Protein [Tribolium castaneum]
MDPQKLQAKNVIISQWNLVNQLKTTLSKFTNEKTVENALNQEFTKFLQRIQPTINGIDLTKYFNALSLPIFKNSEQISETTVAKNSVKEMKKVVPKWKENSVTTKESVASRTHQILDLLASAKSHQTILNRTEALNAHLNKYPEAKHFAVKSNAIPLLLKIKTGNANNDTISGAVNETLALLGYAGPVSGKGVRILSIDGGGVRGILVIEMLKKLEELTGKRISEMFDLICGVSTGAIIASLVGVKRYTLDEISEIYKNLSTQIFTQSALKGTSSLVWSHSYYDTARWEKLLQEQIGNQTLISTARSSHCPRLCVLSAVVNQSRLSAYVFRNYSLPCRVQSQYLGSHKHLIWEAVRASAAAPTYFEEFKLENMLHQDGGILFNNPTAVAIHEARLLWPEAPIQCVLSFGTGRTIPLPVDPNTQKAVRNSSWKSKFYAIIESATDTEGVHTMLSDLLPPSIYYRFNPYLTEMLDIAEIDPKKVEQLLRDAVMYLRRNEDKFHEAARVLLQEKSLSQKAIDWLSLQQEIRGFRRVPQTLLTA